MPGPRGSWEEKSRVSAVDFGFEMPSEKKMEVLDTGSQSALGLCPHWFPQHSPPTRFVVSVSKVRVDFVLNSEKLS